MPKPALDLPPERTGRPASEDLAARRQGLTDAIASDFFRTDPPGIETRIAGTRVLRFEPEAQPRAIVLHFHGGAFRIGAPEAVASFAAALASRCEVSVVCPAYRLAPEFPFPAAISDALATLREIEREGRPIIISGNSAGGGIATAATLLAGANGHAPAGLALLSPWLDLTLDSACYESNAATDPLFSRASASEAAALYLQGASALHPLASPLLAPLAGLPRTFVNYGTGEVLANDSIQFATSLKNAGVSVTTSAVEGMEHVAVTRSLALPGAQQTFEALCAFVDALLTR